MKRKCNPYQRPIAFTEASDTGDAFDLKVGPYIFLQTTYDGNLFHAPGQMFVTKQWVNDLSNRKKSQHIEKEYWSVKKIRYQHRITHHVDEWENDAYV
tara:strand:- start:260 stop:553 length:294 start_codon:yes stop_codon:yes gene_type:complete